jgi:hypothetical protein
MHTTHHTPHTVGDHVSPNLATALYYEGITMQNSSKLRALGKEDDSGHFDLEASLTSNFWAGHGEEAREAGIKPIVSKPPHLKLFSRPISTGETCVQDISSFKAARQQRRSVPMSAESTVTLQGFLPRVGPPPAGMMGSLRASGPPPQLPLPPSIRSRQSSVGMRAMPASPLPSSPLLLSGSREVPSISSKRRISDLSDESDPDEDGSLSPISQRQQSMLAEERIAAQEAAVASLAAREHPQSGAAASSSGAVVAPACAASSSGATIVVPPVQLHQASQSSTKRSKHGQNKWLCICSDPDAARARGQPWHHSQCPRKRWTDGDAGLTSDPIVGQVVQLIASDRMPSAKVGWKYQYTGRKAPHGPWIRTA